MGRGKAPGGGYGGEADETFCENMLFGMNWF